MLKKVISVLFKNKKEQERRIRLEKQLQAIKFIDELKALDEKEKYLRRFINVK